MAGRTVLESVDLYPIAAVFNTCNAGTVEGWLVHFFGKRKTVQPPKGPPVVIATWRGRPYFIKDLPTKREEP